MNKNKVPKERGRPKNRTWLRNPVIYSFIFILYSRCCFLYCFEVQALLKSTFGVEATVSSINKVVKDVLGLKRKKFSNVAWYRNTDRNKKERIRFGRLISKFDMKNLIFLDESHVDYRNISRGYGRSVSGEEAIAFNNPNRGSYSTICAISHKDVCCYHSFDTSQTGLSRINFFFFLLDLLDCIDTSKDVIVLDNVRIHHGDLITSMLQRKGVKFIFTSQYSPDLSPIEFVFGLMKAKMRSYQVENIFANGSPLDLIDRAFAEIKAEGVKITNFYNHCSKKWKAF